MSTSTPLATLRQIPPSSGAKRTMLKPPTAISSPAPADADVHSARSEQHLRLGFGRAMTPSTSTVAHSSSPAAGRLVSSPPLVAAGRPEKEHTTLILDGAPLVFGRHRYHGSSSSAPTTPLAALPAFAQQLFASTGETTHLRLSLLPRSAKHASRTHAIVQPLPLHGAEGKGQIRLIVIGQNGLRVRSNGMTRRIKAGSRVDLGPEAELDFYGSKITVQLPGLRTDQASMELVSEERERERLFTPPPYQLDPSHGANADMPSSPLLSLPPSSPPLAPAESDMSDLEDEPSPVPSHLPYAQPKPDPESKFDIHTPSEAKEETISLPPVQPSLDRLPSSPLSVAEDILSLSPLSDSSPISRQVKEEMLESALSLPPAAQAPSVSAPPQPPSPPSLAIPPPPPEVDLPALLVSGIVFSGSSKLSLPDLVRHILDSQPSLRSLGPEEHWEAWSERVVEGAQDGQGMFGKVDRHGKDASGRPLLPHYFYVPGMDTDRGRAKELGGLVRPLRAAQRTGGKALDWRPVGGGRRR